MTLLLPSPSPTTLVILTACFLIPALGLVALSSYMRRGVRHKTVLVLVLGDIGRSPRMMYHAESFAKEGWDTYLVGYPGSTPIHSLLKLPRVRILHLAHPPAVVRWLPFLLGAPIKIVYQSLSVLYTCLLILPYHPQLIVVQNPPSIPTLALAQLVTWLRKSQLIIDWHNTGYSILAMRVGSKSILVKAAKWFEKTFGRKAYAHLFVTNALAEFLTHEWKLQGKKVVLHDRPPPHFRRTGPMGVHELFTRIVPKLSPPLPPSFRALHKPPKETILTKVVLDNGTTSPILDPERPAMVVSSTSWTADEDFSLLVTALDKYQATDAVPKLLVIISGVGPLRADFEKTVKARIDAGKWTKVAAACIWVEAKDYPVLLGSADFGVSLHASSSGRDLPMKVVDMFGCGLPVLAKSFPCIAELVRDGNNGRVFETGQELGDQMIELLTSFPSSPLLDRYRSYFPASRTLNAPGAHRASSPSTSSNDSQRRSATSPTPEDDFDAREWYTWDENWKLIVGRRLLRKEAFDDAMK